MANKMDRYSELYGGGDPSKEGKGGDFNTFDDGEYKVNGIAKWFSVDESDPPLPVFVPNFDGSMVARCNLRLAEAKDGVTEGPPWSGTRAEIVALVQAFGGDTAKLPEGEGSGFLLAAQKSANESAQAQTARVKGGKGWARYVEGATPPDETYLWKFIGARGLDRKELAFQKKTEEWNGKKIEKQVIVFQFQIVGKPNGKPSPYNGYLIEVEVREPFDGYRYKADGKPIPNMLAAKNGGMLPSVKDFFNWMDIFFPTHWDWQWQEDPEQSPYGTNELDNPIQVYVGEAVKAKQTALAKMSLTKGGRPFLKLDDFSKSGMEEDEAGSVKQTDPIELENLVRTIEKHGGSFKPTAANSDTINTDFTDEGKEWAKKYLGPLCDALRYPRVIRKMSVEQMADLTKHLPEVAGKDEKEVQQYILSLEHDEAF